MKDLKKPQSKEKTIALGFTLGIHAVAITGLLFLGMSKPVEPPKQIKMVLVTPEDLLPPDPVPLEQTDSTETAHEKLAEQVASEHFDSHAVFATLDKIKKEYVDSYEW